MGAMSEREREKKASALRELVEAEVEPDKCSRLDAIEIIEMVIESLQESVDTWKQEEEADGG